MEWTEQLGQRMAGAGPIRVGLVGAGAFAGMIVRHLARSVPWVRLVAVASRDPARAVRLLHEAGASEAAVVGNAQECSAAIGAGRVAVCADFETVCSAPELELLIEATGSVEWGAPAVLLALEHRRHVVLGNAELDATLGPLLKRRADERGVVITHADGEEPALAAQLVRYLRSIGLSPVAAGNLKGMLDRYRTPESQRDFAACHGLNAAKAASFADGTKLSLECCVLANATGFRVGRMGMHGPSCEHVREMADRLPAAEMLDGGLVDYALAREPSSGVFAVVHVPDEAVRRDLAYFKMGPGPFHVFAWPFHLPGIQIASSIGRAVLHGAATVAPRGAPVCAVIAVAKRDLRAGEVLDGVGGVCAYGSIVNAAEAATGRMLPVAVSAGGRLTRSLRRDEIVRWEDVEFPRDRLCDRLLVEQAVLLPPAAIVSTSSGPVL